MVAIGHYPDFYTGLLPDLAEWYFYIQYSHMEQSTKTVYVVEDDVFLGKVISEQIREQHIDATQFTSGKEALDAILKKKPDLLLLDIFLPDINGLDILAVIRQHDEVKDVPVIVVSNTDEAKDRLKAHELGAEFMIKAASSPDDIVAQVRQTLKL